MYAGFLWNPVAYFFFIMLLTMIVQRTKVSDFSTQEGIMLRYLTLYHCEKTPSCMTMLSHSLRTNTFEPLLLNLKSSLWIDQNPTRSSQHMIWAPNVWLEISIWGLEELPSHIMYRAFILGSALGSLVVLNLLYQTGLAKFGALSV